jgi:hypothetical protein
MAYSFFVIVSTLSGEIAAIENWVNRWAGKAVDIFDHEMVNQSQEASTTIPLKRQLNTIVSKICTSQVFQDTVLSDVGQFLPHGATSPRSFSAMHSVARCVRSTERTECLSMVIQFRLELVLVCSDDNVLYRAPHPKDS